jgi:hypothetical protein
MLEKAAVRGDSDYDPVRKLRDVISHASPSFSFL